MKLDTMEKITLGAGVVLVALVLTFMVAAAIDLTQSYRAEPQEIACRTKRMEHVRRSFSTNVTCVPYLTRQDTLTIKN